MSTGLSNARSMGDFVASLGPHCPFCGKMWSDRSACGETPYKSWQQQNDEGIFFPGRRTQRRTGQPRTATFNRKCVMCGTDYVTKNPNSIYDRGACKTKAYKRRKAGSK